MHGEGVVGCKKRMGQRKYKTISCDWLGKGAQPSPVIYKNGGGNVVELEPIEVPKVLTDMHGRPVKVGDTVLYVPTNEKFVVQYDAEADEYYLRYPLCTRTDCVPDCTECLSATALSDAVVDGSCSRRAGHEDRRCGTCRYWDTTKRTLPDSGRCKMDGKRRFKGDMTDCFGWKGRE